MAYIGRSPTPGEVIVLNSIESQFNGVLTTFNLSRTTGGVTSDFYPVSSGHMLVSLGGVIQKPDPTGDTGFRINYNTIIFAVAPLANTSCFIVSYGNIIDIGTPADLTVTPLKLSTGGPSWDTSGNVTVGGNLTVNGSTTTINSTTLTIDDKNIVVADGQSTSAGIDTAGIDFGTSSVKLRYYHNGGTNSGLNIEGTNVGIGETNPSRKLTVGGDIQIGFTTPTNATRYLRFAADLSIANDSIGSQQWYWGSNIISQISGNTIGSTTNKNSGELVFFTANSGSLTRRMTIGSGGLVGVGDITPSANFHVGSLSNTAIRIANTDTTTFSASDTSLEFHYSGGGGAAVRATRPVSGSSSSVYLAFFTGGVVGANERVRIDSSGNVGIGTNAPTSPLVVASTTNSNYSANSVAFNTDIRNLADYTVYPSACAGIRMYAGNSNAGGGVIAGVRVGPSNQGDIVLAPTDPSGNPVERLRVTSSGNVLLTNDTSRFVGQYEGGTVNPATANYFAGMECRLGADRNLILVSKTGDAGGNIIFQSGYTTTGTVPERLRITSTGNVGIGTTIPFTKLDTRGALHVGGGSDGIWLGNAGDNSAYDNVKLYYTGYNSGSPRIYLTPRTQPGSGGVNTYLHLQSNNVPGPGANNMGLIVDGSVGIGTTVPQHKLHLISGSVVGGSGRGGGFTKALFESNDATGAYWEFQTLSTSTVNDILFSRGTGGNYGIVGYNNSTDTMRFYTASTEKLTITSTGNVGIGLNPSYKLDVNGSIRVYSSTVGSRPYLYLTYDVTPVDGAAHGRITVFKSSQNSYSGKIHLQPQYYTGSTYDYLPDALVVDASGHIGIGTPGPSERLHVVTPGITASAPSNGWPVYNAEADTNARRILFETAGNGNVSSTGQGATLALVLGNYWDSRVVITPVGAGGASPSDQGTSRGKDMLIKAGTSDNNNVLGGRLFLSGGSGYNGGYNTNYGVVSIQPFGGNVGIGTTSASFGKLEVRGGAVACYGAGFNSWSTDFSTYVVDYAKGGYSVWPGLESGRWMTHYGAFVSAGNAGARIYSYQNGSINATICDLHPSGSTIYSGLSVQGALSKSSGSFKIDHPLSEKTETHYLVHSFVESPQANNIYRGKVTLVNGEAQVNLDEVSGMTEGTFVLLNRDIHCFTSNESDWDNVKGNVQGNILTIICQNPESTATISWLVIGERHDQHMYDTDWTDDNGRVIVEPKKII